METTVDELRRARWRHFALAIVFGAITLGATLLGSTLQTRYDREARRAPAAATLGITHAGKAGAARLGSVARSEPVIATAVMWVAIVSVVVFFYHFQQWRGKSRRFYNQRHRAANELLRADFRRGERW
jgi:hypothetical protein